MAGVTQYQIVLLGKFWVGKIYRKDDPGGNNGGGKDWVENPGVKNVRFRKDLPGKDPARNDLG